MTMQRHLHTRTKRILTVALLVLPVMALAACAAFVNDLNRSQAKRIAMPVFMLERTVPAGPLELKAFERVHERGAAAMLYIGAGAADAQLQDNVRVTPGTFDGTALRMAAQDKSRNVLFLARPCQLFAGAPSSCPDSYNYEAQFSPGIIEAYDKALDNIKRYYNIPEFHLVGYSGGAAIAHLVAANRGDIASIRTVAGILDHEALTRFHDMPPLDRSLNPAEYTEEVANIPQFHLLGRNDLFIPPAIYYSYVENAGERRCINSTIIEQATHNTGWVERWRSLLEFEPECALPSYARDIAPSIEINPVIIGE